MRFARIPDRLRDALEREAEDLRPGELVHAARTLSDRYRAGLPVRLDTHADRLAYALTRMPATFGAISAALREVPFQPASLLDLGAGPGTALWAFQSHWGDPAHATAVELNREWQHLAARLESPSAEWRMADLRAMPDFAPHDLVICSYALNELSQLERGRAVEKAWQATAKGLLLLEPGTPGGFHAIRTVREWLVQNGAFIGAPCPHDAACPLQSPDWCHFAVRVERTRLHRLAKGGELGYEDEKFSYVLALREPPAARPPRILRHPQVGSGRIDLRLCTADGLQNKAITKRDKPEWKVARKASWGDRWTPQNSDPGDSE